MEKHIAVSSTGLYRPRCCAEAAWHDTDTSDRDAGFTRRGSAPQIDIAQQQNQSATTRLLAHLLRNVYLADVAATT